MVAANPCAGNSWRTMLGNTNPPVAVPHAAMPMARLRLVVKYVDSVEMHGQNRHPLPSPMQMPSASSTCQYCVATDTVKMPMIWKATPSANTWRK